MAVVYATIVIELSKAGLHAICEELETDVFCTNGNLEPLMGLISDAEAACNPDAVFSLTEKGMEEVKKLEELEEK